MRLSLFIAGRYLFSKRNKQAINIISWIATTGVCAGTAALVIVLSVFNGFESLISELYTSFDPNYKLVAPSGKYFDANENWIKKIKDIRGVSFVGFCIEDNALMRYQDKQNFVQIKGYHASRLRASGLQKYIRLAPGAKFGHEAFGMIPGAGVSYSLGLHANSITPAQLYAPNPEAGNSGDISDALISRSLPVGGVFSVQQEYDSRCVIIPYAFAAELTGKFEKATGLEIFLLPDANPEWVENEIRKLKIPLKILNRYALHEDVYKIMKTEKMAVFLILTFILLIAAFNISSSLTMLIIEKKKDIRILQIMGADQKITGGIFLSNGLFITLLGTLIGTLIGVLICFLQKQYGLVELSHGGSFIIRYYPVKMIPSDILMILLTVCSIGFFASFLPLFGLSRQQKIN